MKKWILRAVLLLWVSLPASAGVVAWWRFEEGPAGANVARGGQADGVFFAGVADSSGGGNTLSAWSDGGNSGHAYRDDLASGGFPPGGGTNRFSVQNTGTAPGMFSDPGSSMRTMTPAAWTIEASFKAEDGGWRTLVGRDSEGATATDLNLAALYFQITPDDAVAIKFVDVSGTWHIAVSEPGLIQGFSFPDSASGRWYHMAAVCDGNRLFLYLDDVATGFGYRLVAETDLTPSGSPDRRLTAGLGSGSDWTAGTWTVGRGMYNGAHGDRAYGLIDEVRISDEALSPNRFLHAYPLLITDAGALDAGGTNRFWLEWTSRNGGNYRVSASTNLVTGDWAPQAVAIPATPPANVWTSGTEPARTKYYRVEPELPASVLTIDPGQVLNPIAENVYGHFLEHIYHSANGGLWGELVWNRSLETWPAGTFGWSIEGSDLVQSSLDTNVRLLFGDTAWTDYEFTLQARKDGGNEGFLILFRADGEDFYWANLGGWGNARHQLEKGIAGSGWGAVGPSVNGAINAGQWVDIRVRCEGNRLRIWLDSVNIIDWADTSGAHLSGQVGLGTWATQARYRSLLVQNLGGNTLYSGLPPVSGTGSPPVFWDAYGTVSVAPTTDAANSTYALALTKPAAAEAGLRQTPFRFDPQPYTGSFWARGSGISGMTLRLKDLNTVLAARSFPAPTASWQKYTFQLTPSAAALDGTLELAFLGAGSVLVDQVSLMGQDAIDTGGFRPDLLDLAAGLRPPIIRWPGGCFASAYRWKSGIGPQDDRVAHPVVQWDDQDVNAYGTDEFLRMCEILGTEPILVINTGITSPCGIASPIVPFPSEAELLQDALDWIEYCNGNTNTTWGARRAANGHPEPYNVKYWEIDNETWSMGSAWYTARVNQYAPLMRQADPTITLIAVGGNGYDQGWNQDILDACAANIDYISVHSYFDPGGWASVPAEYENHIISLAARIAASANPDIQIYNSEWNAQSIDFRTGLFAGGLLNVFERQGAVFSIGGPALMFRHLSATAWNNAFMNFDHTGSFAAPNYIVMKLWRDHYAPWRIQAEGAPSSLNLVATRSDDGGTVYVKVINPSSLGSHVYLNLPAGTAIADAELLYVTAPTLLTENSLAAPDAVRVTTGPATVAGPTVDVTFPGQSASVVTLQLQ